MLCHSEGARAVGLDDVLPVADPDGSHTESQDRDLTDASCLSNYFPMRHPMSVISISMSS
ncbi:hypothetical protein GCM10007079_19770 [Nocardiopsis terrae]|nr:hypothetical protein GCM10007079_19770 [Nocardiopsis terrae]